MIQRPRDDVPDGDRLSDIENAPRQALVSMLALNINDDDLGFVPVSTPGTFYGQVDTVMNLDRLDVSSSPSSCRA